jgi:hypothetical protein
VDDSEWSETEGAMSWRDEVDAVMAQANAAASEQEQAAADKRDQISHNHEQATAVLRGPIAEGIESLRAVLEPQGVQFFVSERQFARPPHREHVGFEIEMTRPGRSPYLCEILAHYRGDDVRFTLCRADIHQPEPFPARPADITAERVAEALWRAYRQSLDREQPTP